MKKVVATVCALALASQTIAVPPQLRSIRQFPKARTWKAPSGASFVAGVAVGVGATLATQKTVAWYQTRKDRQAFVAGKTVDDSDASFEHGDDAKAPVVDGSSAE